ncbi:MurR/RpiR family transcriptional regulator [Spiroplasma endosymbiont of Othius punctulatus]|uniref:MurR/RpiR family transcriptional regulator n=1 Tax=Spiroplasma endosymbiont of Othius punctulatus TaxID=3066289 RepID=UPI0030D1634E
MKINIKEERLTPTDKHIIRALNKELENIAGMPIESLGKEISVSISTISKFVKKAGFENYRKFQFFLQKSLDHKNNQEIYTKISESKNKEILTMKNHDFYAIEETSKLINNSDLNLAIKLINKSKVIWCLGHGNSYLAALDFSNSLNLTEKISFTTNDISGSINRIKMLKDSGLVIFFSERFNDKEYDSLIENVLSKNKVKVIVFTASNKVFINNKSVDVVINFYAFERETRNTLIRNVKVQQIFLNNFVISKLNKF